MEGKNNTDLPPSRKRDLPRRRKIIILLHGRKQNEDTLQELLATTTVEAMEQHWKIIKDGLFPIAYSFFAVNDKSPRKPWASDELAALTLEKQRALQIRKCVVYIILPQQ